MSNTSPDDLVVSFRSVPRRLREAQGDTPHDQFNRLSIELSRLLGEAGLLVETSADPERIADAIAATRAERWNEATLARLRDIGLAIGHELRAIAAAGER